MQNKETNKEMEQKVSEIIYRLPPMPENLEKLLALSPGHDDSPEKIIGIIKSDPGLCADLLHLANSFCSPPLDSIDTVEDAVESVGVMSLVQLMRVLYAREVIDKEFSELPHIDDYFSHSRHISKGCLILAEICGFERHQQQMYAVAGLIHDIGRLVMMIAARSTSSPLIGSPPEKMSAIVQDERQAFGMDHCEIGMRLCSRWNFSEMLQSGVLRHHSPILKDDFDLPGAMIFTAHFVAESDITGEILCQRLPAELLDNLELSRDDFIRANNTYVQTKST